ncbi:hypothetical protein [Flavobacterium chungangense]|uniref:Uncharacterized protein n=1 Tax=Flavobacterium chungangense TaxID=554283 RepID=A0A6V6Z6D9_9FLAO|nr:hypothetical protein [Flavobacterium chungangense]CAD0007340.1 hypothetical protein FLACHUCJ7_03270 [Flavobacterium chungangense]
MTNTIKGLKKLKITGGIIWLLELIYGKNYLTFKLDHLRTLQHGTVGREVVKMLDSKQYRLIPKFENHDLKHIVLEYEMTMKDEIRMQAYLIGNGNFTFPCLLFFSLGIFYPRIWKDLFKEYQEGKTTKSIHYLTLDNCMESQLKDIKSEYGRIKNNSKLHEIYKKT